MRNRRKPGSRTHLRVRYKCEGCQEDFTVISISRENDPYPRQPDTPVEENEIICTPCRRAQEEAFRAITEAYEAT